MIIDKARFVALMQRLTLTWNENNTPLALAHFTEDAVYIEPPDIQSYKGHNQLRLFFDDLTLGTTMEWHNLWFDEDTQRGAGEYTFHLGGSEHANHGVAVVELRDGLIASWREYQQRGPLAFDVFLGQEGKERQQSVTNLISIPPQQPATKISPRGLHKLKTLLEMIPAISQVATSTANEPEWWLKFSIDIKSPIAWHVVQELGHVLNYISLQERLHTIFMPVSPPPYLNGGPDEYLSWVIEARGSDVDAGIIADTLKGRLPDPIEDAQAWRDTDEEEEEEEDV